MKRLILLGLMVVFVFILASGVMAIVNCNSTIGGLDSTFAGCNAGASLELETGIYYANTTDFVIRATANNIVINGNYSTIIGNWSGNALYATSRNNVTFKNFNISHYSRGIWFVGGNNNTFYNNTFRNNNIRGIAGRNLNNTNISGNSILGNGSTSQEIGIILDTSGQNNTIFDNLVNLTYSGILIDNSVFSTLISSNTVMDSITNQPLIWTSASANYTTIYGNTLFNAGWNAIDINSWHNNVSFNLINNSNHHSIDLYETASDGLCGYNNIYNNTIYSSESTNDANGIYIRNSTSNNVFNNIIRDLIQTTVSTTQGHGIAVDNEEGSISQFNEIYDNTITNVSQSCIAMSDLDNSYRDNTINLCGSEGIRISSGSNNTFNYNVLQDTIAHIKLIDEKITDTHFRFPTSPSALYLLNYTESSNTEANITLHKTNLTGYSIYNFTDKSFITNNFLADEINITFSSAPQLIYILDTPTILEGTGLTNSGNNLIDASINISTSGTTKHIRSSVSTPFNATVTVNNPLDCSRLTTITYTSDSGTYGQTWTAGTDFTCASTITLSILGIEQSASSNVLEFNDVVDSGLEGAQEGLDAFASFFVIIAVVLAALIVLIFVSFFKGETTALDLINNNLMAVTAVVLTVIFAVVVGLLVIAEMIG